MKTVLLTSLLSISFAATAFASETASHFETVFYCHQAGIADAGKVVSIQYNDSKKQWRALLSDDSFMGPRNERKISLNREVRIGATTYSDKKTGGKEFSLSYAIVRPTPAGVKASLSLDDSSGRGEYDLLCSYPQN